MDEAKPNPAAAIFAEWNDLALLDFIEGITAELKGPGIPYGERIAMHEDRKAARAELARRHP